MLKKTSQNWRKIRFGDLLESSIKVDVKKGNVYDSLPMDMVSASRKFPKAFESKVFGGGGARFADGDTVFARITPCLQNGKIAKIKNLKGGIGFGSTEFFVLRAKKDAADPDYIFYLAKTSDVRGPAEKSMIGASGRQRADKGVVENIVINAPDLSIQKKIASVLSVYDDLVENNNCRIKILEAIVQKIYTKWFVNFRFPGYEKVKFGKGGLPEGWEIKKIREIGRVVTGKTPPTSNKDNQGDYMPFIKTPDLHDSVFCISTNESLSIQGVEAQKNKIIPKNSIVVSCIGTVGVTGITVKESQTNQQINSIIPIDFSIREYLYFVCIGLKQHLKNIGANGATMGNVNKEKFETIEIILPSKDILGVFHEATSDLFEEILALSLQNQNLEKTRDLLIPRLVTGKLKLK
jgi:type I restriction enzyme, S subunit